MVSPLRDMFMPHEPTQHVKDLTDPNRTHRTYPIDSVDKDPSTGPTGPIARASTRSHNYEIFMCSVDFPSDNQTLSNRKNRSQLAAGTFHLFRAAFQPDYWEVYTFKGTGSAAGDLLYFDPGTDSPALPADVIVTTADVSGIRRVPGRGQSLGVWTPSTNAGSVSLVAKAVASLATDVVGAVDE